MKPIEWLLGYESLHPHVGLYSEPEGVALCVLEGHRGGVTHLKFSPDGMVLYSGGRKDPEILW